MIEINELLSIIIDIVSFSFLLIAGSKVNFQRFKLIILAVIFVVLSHTATVVEGFLLPNFFNVLEHLFLLSAMITLLFAVSRIAFKSECSGA